jgi:hypothetical protein
MKRIYLAIVVEENEKYYAFAEAIRTGENLKPYIERHKANIFHLCESKKEAETLVLRWNATFMANNTYLFSEPSF